MSPPERDRTRLGVAREDRRLALRAQGGDRRAFGQLVERFQRPVFNVIIRMARDPDLAEDLAQETFVRAFRRLATYNPEYRFSSWIFRIAHNLTLDHFRRRRLDSVSLDTPVEAGGASLGTLFLADEASETPLEGVERANLAAALERALDHLRPEYREVILLRFREDFSYEEIARIMGLPLGTIKTFLFRARKTMARDLRRAGWGDRPRT